MNLLTRFPKASNDFIKANPQLQSAQSQPDAKAALGASTKGKEKSLERIAIRYRIYRVRLQDADNAFGGTKNLTDGLVRCGLIPSDSPEQISLTVEQEKVSSLAEQRTEIQIKWPNSRLGNSAK